MKNTYTFFGCIIVFLLVLIYLKYNAQQTPINSQPTLTSLPNTITTSKPGPGVNPTSGPGVNPTSGPPVVISSDSKNYNVITGKGINLLTDSTIKKITVASVLDPVFQAYTPSSILGRIRTAENNTQNNPEFYYVTTVPKFSPGGRFFDVTIRYSYTSKLSDLVVNTNSPTKSTSSGGLVYTESATLPGSVFIYFPSK